MFLFLAALLIIWTSNKDKGFLEDKVLPVVKGKVMSAAKEKGNICKRASTHWIYCWAKGTSFIFKELLLNPYDINLF